MKSKIRNIVVMMLSLCLIGCAVSTLDEVSDKGGICGVVTDFATGEPVKNANVQLRPSGETTLTGTDGYYEFNDIKAGDYSITVSKIEYTDLIDNYVISVVPDKTMRRDVQIKKEPSMIRVIDNDGNDLSVLDFGNKVTTKQFVVFNSGPISIDCKIVASCDWIVSISQIENQIQPGGVWPVIVTIDRSLLKAGENSAYIHVVSNNGSKELDVLAIGDYITPQVVTLPVTTHDGKDTPWNDTFNAEVTEVGNPAYHKRGFCFSSIYKNPTVDDSCIEVSGTGLGKYMYYYMDIPLQTVTYYVRAWLMYGEDNNIVYGNTETFTYNDV